MALSPPDFTPAIELGIFRRPDEPGIRIAFRLDDGSYVRLALPAWSVRTMVAGLLSALQEIDHPILYAMAAELGEMCIPLPAIQAEANAQTAAKVCLVAQEFGLLMAELAEDLADNRITNNELSRIESKWGELIGAGQAMLKHFASMNAVLQGEVEG